MMALEICVGPDTYGYRVGDLKGPDFTGKKSNDAGYRRSVISRITEDDSVHPSRFVVYVSRQQVSIPWVRCSTGYRAIMDVSEKGAMQ